VFSMAVYLDRLFLEIDEKDLRQETLPRRMLRTRTFWGAHGDIWDGTRKT